MDTKNLLNVIKLTPSISDSVHSSMPEILRKCTNQFEDAREKDVVLLSSLTMFSGLFPSVKGKYMKSHVYSNLFTFIVAPPASLKGSILYGRSLVNATQDRFVKNNEVALEKFKSDMTKWKLTKNGNKKQLPPPPIRPKLPVLLFPGNSTSAAIYKKCHESSGVGILVETEADTLSNSISSDLGNFSDFLRKAFHNEPVTLSRATDDVYLSIDLPKISVLLSGTPNQVPKLIHSVDDGLFSRFLYYIYSKDLEWNDPTPCEGCEDLKEYFNKLSIIVRDKKDDLEKNEHTFKLSKDQFNTLSKNFEAKTNDVKRFEGINASSVVFRMGQIAFRISMILSILRLFESPQTTPGIIECTDADLVTTLKLTDILFEHSLVMYSLLPKNQTGNLKTRVFYNALPMEIFSRAEAIKIGKSTDIDIKPRTIGNYLGDYVKEGIMIQPKHGFYQKVS